MIQVEDFIKRYGDFVAVAGTSFYVPAGAVAALVGPNGAGKTTTIRTLCGILRPTSGRLTVAGADLDADPMLVKKRTAYVPDDPPLFDTLTVIEHLQFIASAYRLTNWRPDADERRASSSFAGAEEAVCGDRHATHVRNDVAGIPPQYAYGVFSRSAITVHRCNTTNGIDPCRDVYGGSLRRWLRAWILMDNLFHRFGADGFQRPADPVVDLGSAIRQHGTEVELTSL